MPMLIAYHEQTKMAAVVLEMGNRAWHTDRDTG